jgi:nucleoside-diphosphate-sugar epimerase
MKVLILGGTGQISQSISRQFLEAGIELTLFTRGKTNLPGLSGYRSMIGDRNDLIKFEIQMADAGTFDCVIDMICFTPEQAESLVRVFGNRIGQLIFCSSAAVYQRPASKYPITEAEPLIPTSSYGQNKARCERVLLSAQEKNLFDVTILRPANTYGPGGDLIYTLGWGNGFLDRIRKGKALVSPGDGSALRAYCHADDVGRAFVQAAGNSRAYGQMYHVTGEEWLTWDRYFEIIAQAMDMPLPHLVHIPCDILYAMAPDLLPDVIENYRFNNIFDNQAACQELGFRYTIPFNEGVRQTIAWLDENKRIKDSDLDSFDFTIISAWNARQTGYPLSFSKA